MIIQEAEIILHNGFHNNDGDGELLVGIISEGQVEKNAVLIIEDYEIKMKIIQIRDDKDYNAIRIEFEVDRNLKPPIKWWKFYNSKIKVRNATYNNKYSNEITS